MLQYDCSLIQKNYPLKDAIRDSPVAVCGANIGNILELSETGFCIYDLERIQDGSDVISALEVDFYRADPLASMKDEEVIHVTLKAVAVALKIPNINEHLVVDLLVVRAKNAVSCFCVNSTNWSPDVKLSEGLYIYIYIYMEIGLIELDMPHGALRKQL